VVDFLVCSEMLSGFEGFKMYKLERAQFDPRDQGGVILYEAGQYLVYSDGKKISERTGLSWLEELIANLTSGSYSGGTALFCRAWLSRVDGNEGEGIGISGLCFSHVGKPRSDTTNAEVIEALRFAADELRARIEEQAELERLYRLAYP